MGNCGVGFAPLQPGSEDRLIRLMEGVEDIPGAALKDGVRFAWDSFGEYMHALDAMPHSLDYLAMVPHDPLRMRVMGARAEAREAATAGAIAAMRELLGAALDAGAAGFSTGRSDNHRTAEALDTPALIASATELCGLAQAFAGRQHGVVQVVSDFDLMQGINGLDASFHPFMGFPGYKEIASLSIAKQAAAMRVPAPKARLQRAGGAVRPLQRRRRQRPSVLSDLQLQPGLARRRATDADAPARPFWAWAMLVPMWAPSATPASAPSCSAIGYWAAAMTGCRCRRRWRARARSPPPGPGGWCGWATDTTPHRAQEPGRTGPST